MFYVINNDRNPSVYVIRSRHHTEAAAIKMLRVLGKNGLQGHTTVIPAADWHKWQAAGIPPFRQQPVNERARTQ